VSRDNGARRRSSSREHEGKRDNPNRVGEKKSADRRLLTDVLPPRKFALLASTDSPSPARPPSPAKQPQPHDRRCQPHAASNKTEGFVA
jgi:hypothetical protein